MLLFDMVQGGGQSKGGASKGGSSSEKLSEKKMRKMETKILEEKLVVLRGALFEADGKDKNVCATMGPFMKFDRKGLDVTIEFSPRLKEGVRKWAFALCKETMEDKYPYLRETTKRVTGYASGSAPRIYARRRRPE